MMHYSEQTSHIALVWLREYVETLTGFTKIIINRWYIMLSVPVHVVALSLQTWTWRGTSGVDCHWCSQPQTAEGNWGQDSLHSISIWRKYSGGRKCHPDSGFI